MDILEFSNEVPTEDLVAIFKDFFEQHILAYRLLSDVKFIKINNVTHDKSSIMYSVKLLKDEDKESIVNNLNGIPFSIYGKEYTPNVFLNGDLLCITIEK